MQSQLEAKESPVFKRQLAECSAPSATKHKNSSKENRKVESGDLAMKLNENLTNASNSNSSYNPLMYSFVTFEGKLIFNYLRFCQDNKLIK